MRNTLSLPRPARAARKSRVPQLYCAEILRACEAAAVRLKLASDELAAHWAALTQAGANGVEFTSLTEARLRGQVLEARVQERATALAEARRRVEQACQQEAVAQERLWSAADTTPATDFDEEMASLAFLAQTSATALPLAAMNSGR